MHTTREKLGRMTVAKIMEPYPRQVAQPSYEAGELKGEAQWLVRLAICAAAEERVTRLANA